MKKQVIKLGYVDFGSTFDPKQDWFYKLLSQKYQIELSDSPDYLIYGLFGMKHHTYNCVKIFHTGENMVPNFNCCDYALGFHYISFKDRYMRLPLWRLGSDKQEVLSLQEAIRQFKLEARMPSIEYED